MARVEQCLRVLRDGRCVGCVPWEVSNHLAPSAVYGCAVRGLHTGVGVGGHVRITTHPSVVLREHDERWKGVHTTFCS